MSCYLYAGRKSLVFRMNMKNELFFVWVVQIELISVRGVECSNVT